MAFLTKKIGGADKVSVFVILFYISFTSIAQTRRIDSLKAQLPKATDTLRPYLLNNIAQEIISTNYTISKPRQDSLLHIAKKSVTEAEFLSRQLNYTKGTGVAIFLAGEIKIDSSWNNASKALKDFENALPYLKLARAEPALSTTYYRIAEINHFLGNIAKSIAYYDTAINSFLQIRDTIKATTAMIWQGHDYFDRGDYKNAYLFITNSLSAAQKIGDTALKVFAYTQLQSLFLKAGLPERSVEYLRTIIKLSPLTKPKGGKTSLPFFTSWAVTVGGEAYLQLNKIDSAIYLSQFIPLDTLDGDSYRFYGQLYTALGQHTKAIDHFVRGFEVKKRQSHSIGIAGNAVELARIYLKKKEYRLSIYYAKYGLSIAEKIPAALEMRDAAGSLSEIFAQTKDYRQAYFYSQLYKSLNDSLASEEDRRKLSLDLIQNELNNEKQQSILLVKENQLKQQQLHSEKVLRNFFIVGAITFLLVALIMFRNYKQKQKSNNLLEQQKKEIQNTLSELKATQVQLIQSAKMASLGELTAGIAHEIQNPLNFVNNFSDINKELLIEMKEHLMKGNTADALTIANDIVDNEEKINHHGKRADAIVKSMLQHSRSSSAKKEPIDINALVNECLRLSYHGIKAKVNSFNATTELQLDDSIKKLKIIPQDIGRALLNLFTNAFYAVNEKTKQELSGYEPTVDVSTKAIDGNVEIRVKDNGNGIPDRFLDKIFQPFFTTKPPGQGTGLGLSLAYDIITKVHGGELKVETKEGEGTEFIIQLPV